jgi:hypothetical protein
MPIIASRAAASARGYGLTSSSLDVVKTNLVLHLNAANSASYPGSGNTWYDLSGSGLNASGGSAISGQALSQNQPYYTASSGILNTDTHSIFFSIQINNSVDAWDKIFGFPSGSDRSPGVWRYPNQRLIHWRYDPNNSGCDFGKDSSNTQFDTNTWYYVGVTKNGGTAKTYVNGVNTTTQSVSNPKSSGNAVVELYPYFNGSALSKMRHVHVYNRVISDAEVLNNYNAIKGQLV